MKLALIPEELPIEAAEGLSSLLGTLIGTLSDHRLVGEVEDLSDYTETLSSLRADLRVCEKLYDDWLNDPDSEKHIEILNQFQDRIIRASALLDHCVTESILH